MKKEEILRVYSWSDLASFLIKEAAKCESYASDVFYELEDIKKSFNTDTPCSMLIGFRDKGVDSTCIVRCKLGDDFDKKKVDANYFALYCVMISFDGYTPCATVEKIS